MKAYITLSIALALQLSVTCSAKPVDRVYHAVRPVGRAYMYPIKRVDTGNSTNGTVPNSASARASVGTIGVSVTAMATQTAHASLNATTTRSPNATEPLKSDDPIASSVGEDQLNPSNSGAQEIYNLANITCKETSGTDAKVLWDSLEGDRVYGQFQKMLSANALVCTDCFGLSKDMCKSDRPDCAKGLADLAKDDAGKVRWDRALARFSKDADLRDMICEINTGGTCSAPPSCEASQGPGAWIILKSITTIYSFFDSVYDAIAEARTRLSTQMDLFSSTFAPVPDVKDESMLMTIMTAVGCGLLGFIPGAGGILAGTAAGVGSGVVMENFFMNQPKPAQPEQYLQAFTDAAQAGFKDIADGFFRDGEYTFMKSDGSAGETLSLRERLADGANLDQSSNPKDFFDQLVPNFEKILLQQLVVLTWQHMQTDKMAHIPFIAFDDVPCDKVNHEDENSLAQKMRLTKLKDLDSGYTYDNKCYYLLDGKKTENQQTSSRAAMAVSCGGNYALPGGTNKGLSDVSQQFSGLSLGDFIEPPVKAWLENDNTNDYKLATDSGNLVSDPRDAGAIRIPVCDYVGNPGSPGVDCPRLGDVLKDDKCQIFDKSTGTNAPGEYQQGYCKLHFKQYQKNQANEVNPLDEYQLEVTIYDDSDRVVGQASKQPSGTPMEITDTSLPFHLIAWTNRDDENPVEFWYSDQYWKSDDPGHNCKVGPFDSKTHAREGDCGFGCNPPSPNNPAPVSITESIKLPAAPKTALGAATTLVNTFRPAATTTGTASTTTATSIPQATYATGRCGVHVRQYQKNDERNGVGAFYQLEVTVRDAAQKALGASGKANAKEGEPFVVQGLNQPLNLSVGPFDNSTIGFAFGDQKWDSKATDQPHACSVGPYSDGHRDMDCTVLC